MEHERHRRPDWKGERRPVITRLPVDVVEALRAVADEQGQPVNVVVNEIVASGLAGTRHSRDGSER